jgi:glutamine cyclotransferase
MLSRLRRPAVLLDRYWTELFRSGRRPEPPSGLDPTIADVVNRLAEDMDRLAIRPSFQSDLGHRLETHATERLAQERRAWSGPMLAPRRRWPTNNQTDTELEEHVVTSDASTTRPEPTTFQQRRWVREGLKLAAAALIFVIVGAILALTLRDNQDEQLAVPLTPTSTAPTPTATEPGVTATAVATATATRSAATATPAATAAPTRVPRPSLPAAGTIVATIPVGAGPFSIAAGAGSVWVASADGAITRIDPATNAVVATIQFDDPPLTYPKVDFADGAVWATAYGKFRVVKIDPATNQVVETIRTASFVNDIEVGNGVLWYSSFESGAVVRVDLATNTEVARVPVPAPAYVLLTEDAVWVSSAMDQSKITRIDPATNTVAATITLEQSTGPKFAVDETSLWTGAAEHGWASDGSVTRLDLATNQVTAIVPLPGIPLAVDLGDGAVWASFPDTLYRLDPTTNQLVGVLSIPGIWPITYADGSIWAATPDAVVRVDPTP